MREHTESIEAYDAQYSFYMEVQNQKHIEGA